MIIPKTMAISDAGTRRATGITDIHSWLDRLVDLGIDAVQIREKSESMERLFAIVAQAVVRLGHRIKILINGRADLAIACGAAGVHLPSRGVPVSALAERFGGQLMIGVSTHSISEIEQARKDGADYVTFGPVLSTPSKARYGPCQGLDALKAAAGLGLPVVALGGITPATVPDMWLAGASGVAAIRAFHDSAELEGMASLRC